MEKQRIFDDGAKDAYAELPVKCNGLVWRRGDRKLSALSQSDPAQYFGGWRAFVFNKLGEEKPKLPLPIVTREGKGADTYQVYAAPYIDVLPIRFRLRYELKEKYKDESGNERTRIVAVKKKQTKGDGYTPDLQVFCLVFSRSNPETYAPAVLYIDNWSSFISYGNAGTAWKKIKSQPNTQVVRRYGTNGEKVKDKNGVEKWIPKLESSNGGEFTPIEALIGTPRFFVINEEINTLWDGAEEWVNCPRWNAQGEMKEDAPMTPKQIFLARAAELNMSDAEIEQCLASCNGDYSVAYGDIQAMNDPGDEEGDFPF